MQLLRDHAVQNVAAASSQEFFIPPGACVDRRWFRCDKRFEPVSFWLLDASVFLDAMSLIAACQFLV